MSLRSGGLNGLAQLLRQLIILFGRFRDRSRRIVNSRENVTTVLYNEFVLARVLTSDTGCQLRPITLLPD